MQDSFPLYCTNARPHGNGGPGDPPGRRRPNPKPEILTWHSQNQSRSGTTAECTEYAETEHKRRRIFPRIPCIPRFRNCTHFGFNFAMTKRSPKELRNPKAEVTATKAAMWGTLLEGSRPASSNGRNDRVQGRRLPYFGFRVSTFLRASAFGFRIWDLTSVCL